MIDIKKTISLRGYDPLMLTCGSNKKVWSVCNKCGNSRWLAYQQYNDLCRVCANKTETKRKKLSKIVTGTTWTNKRRISIMEGILREKLPLPYDHEINKTCKMIANKNCSLYLGVIIAEQILSKIFKNVQRMPNSNHGFDIICDNDYKIDIKSSAIGDKGFWLFNIRKNEIAHYFSLIAFDNREDFNPIHLWLIPGKVINHLTSAVIHKSTIHKWAKYEQSLDKVIKCCNEMRD